MLIKCSMIMNTLVNQLLINDFIQLSLQRVFSNTRRSECEVETSANNLKIVINKVLKLIK